MRTRFDPDTDAAAMAASIWAFVKASVESVPEDNPFTWPDTVTCPAMVVAVGIFDDDVLIIKDMLNL